MYKVVVSYSTGTSSAVCVERCFQKYGRENVSVVFADTLFEHPDNYRFMRDCEKHFKYRFTRLSTGENPYQVWERNKIVPNDLLAPCTRDLKLKPIRAFVKKLQKRGYKVIMAIGMNERDAKRGRLEAPIKNWGELGCEVVYPLLWDMPVNDATTYVKENWGVEPPQMYDLGFSHANCAGRCPKQGQKDWIRTLNNFPELYEEMSQWEQMMIAKGGKYVNRSFMRKTKNGVKSQYTLEQLKADYLDAKNKRAFEFLADIEKLCGVECGIG